MDLDAPVPIQPLAAGQQTFATWVRPHMFLCTKTDLVWTTGSSAVTVVHP